MRKGALFGVVVATAVFISGCGRKAVETPKDLQAVFDAKSNTAATKSAPPEVQAMVNQAVVALEKQDEATAVMNLREVRGNPSLNEAQVLAVEEMLKKAYLTLGERAARGDQAAIAQLEMLKMNRH
jgi:hypothetical protein